jgi:hypothetical protein
MMPGAGDSSPLSIMRKSKQISRFFPNYRLVSLAVYLFICIFATT